MTKDEIAFFDRISETWDADEVLSTPRKVQEILSEIGIGRGWSVLDLGTGTGVLIPFLAGAVGQEGSVVAVDISSGMLAKAERKYGHLANVSLLKRDFEAEPLEGSFDLILLYCVYPHLHQPEDTLKRLVRDNLKREGRIIVAFPTDENFINSIHKERKAESDMLPSAPRLATLFGEWGLDAGVVSYGPEEYIVEIRK